MSVERYRNLTLISPASAKRKRKALVEGFRVHRVGVEIDAGVDQRTWFEFGKLLRQVDYAREWVIADWLAYGEHAYGDKIYELAARLLGKSPRTWEDYAYIARNVRISERSELLPTLVHKPVARFRDDASLQRTLVALAEQHSLSKVVFEAVIELYIERKPYEHLLPARVTSLERARLRAAKERERVLKRARQKGSAAWLDYAREQVAAWRRVLEALESERRTR
jgi:hypothetical protein